MQMDSVRLAIEMRVSYRIQERRRRFQPIYGSERQQWLTPYEGFDVLQNNFGISTVIVEGYKAMRSHCNSNSEESSEYEECGLESSASELKV